MNEIPHLGPNAADLIASVRADRMGPSDKERAAVASGVAAAVASTTIAATAHAALSNTASAAKLATASGVTSIPLLGIKVAALVVSGAALSFVGAQWMNNARSENRDAAPPWQIAASQAPSQAPQAQQTPSQAQIAATEAQPDGRPPFASVETTPALPSADVAAAHQVVPSKSRAASRPLAARVTPLQTAATPEIRAEENRTTEASQATVGQAAAEFQTARAEAQLIRNAERAIAASAWSIASAQLAEHETSFPTGLLQHERQALEVVVLCATSTDDAQKRARFAAAGLARSSPYWHRVAQRCAMDATTDAPR